MLQRTIACGVLTTVVAGACGGADAPGAGSPVPAERATDLVTLGGDIYRTECAACHGPRGEGEPDWQVPRDDGSLPAPPHDGTGHTWHHADAELLAIIADGSLHSDPASRMPAFRDRLSPDEMAAVLAYIKALWGPEQRAYQAERTADWLFMMEQTPATAEP